MTAVVGILGYCVRQFTEIMKFSPLLLVQKKIFCSFVLFVKFEIFSLDRHMS